MRKVKGMVGKRGHRGDALAIWKAGVRAVHAGTLVRDAVKVRGNHLWVAGDLFSLSKATRVVAVGAGKAGAAMARALETALGPGFLSQRDVSGWVNVPGSQAA